jgi:hypothetical protein
VAQNKRLAPCSAGVTAAKVGRQIDKIVVRQARNHSCRPRLEQNEKRELRESRSSRSRTSKNAGHVVCACKALLLGKQLGLFDDVLAVASHVRPMTLQMSASRIFKLQLNGTTVTRSGREFEVVGFQNN